MIIARNLPKSPNKKRKKRQRNEENEENCAFILNSPPGFDIWENH